ncbi:MULTISPECIES: hypothetical protein [unclassified Motilimonas]|uniref:hypothetical protein n=1 Tax=Motilimonas TaxID=1914248 RepID=UPI001E50A2C7|nr:MULTISPECIES: hypothetical protein [unclassified Motilimonas]MCE0558957.1 hypothetical protein [Motilimonas sp. E26]MDO6527402.1 hypothetical protein [Motilimonas sp. 1_MG-2023]
MTWINLLITQLKKHAFLFMLMLSSALVYIEVTASQEQIPTKLSYLVGISAAWIIASLLSTFSCDKQNND